MIHSAVHNVVVYDHPEPGVVVGAIQGARALGASQVAVPTDLFSMQLARVLGLPVPNLLDIHGYDWPIQPGRKPLAHQKYMASFCVAHPRCFNLSDMGTMKTLSTLWAADFLMQQGVVHNALILSPLSVMSTWDHEIFRNLLGRRKAVVLHGDAETRIERLRRNVDFYLLNHDGLKVGAKWVQHGRSRELVLGKLLKRIIEREDIDLVIADEFTYYKEWSSMRTKIMAQLAVVKPYLFLLSGTPTANSPMDAYAPARILGSIKDESERSFRGRVMKQVSTFKFLPLASASDTIRKVLFPAVRFAREECIELPPCVVETRDVELSATQEKAYKDLKRDLSTMIGRGTITAFNEAVLRTKLLQIASGAVYGPDHEAHKTDAAPRIAVLKEIIAEAAAKILVFVPFTSCVDMLYGVLKEEYGETAVARIKGGVSLKARNEILTRFVNDDRLRIIVSDPGCVSHGINEMVAADVTVWWGPTDNNETYDQANKRMDRPGQTRKTLIVQMVSTPIEREIYRRLEAKSSMQGAILKLTEEDR